MKTALTTLKLNDELLAALERLMENCSYHSDADSCECGENGNGRDDDGNVCEHIQAHRAIALAKRTVTS